MLYLGVVDEVRDVELATRRYREAARRFAQDGDPTGEVYARVSLIHVLPASAAGDRAAERELELARRVSERAGSADLRTRVAIGAASRALDRADYGAAYLAYASALRELHDGAHGDLAPKLFNGLGATCWRTGRYEEAIRHYRASAELLRASGDRFGEATARANLAFVATLHLSPEDRKAYARDALELARATGNPTATGASLIYLGNATEDGEAALPFYREALDIARRRGDRRAEMLALWRISAVLPDPDERVAAAERALELARRYGSADERGTALATLAQRLDAAGRMTRAHEVALEAIEVTERVRDSQPDRVVRADQFSRAFRRYADASERLLRPLDTPPSPEVAASAFAILERMRGRQLLERLDAAAAAPEPTPSEDATARRTVLREIAAVQRRLLGESDPTTRASVLDELARLEFDEARLRDLVARRDPRFAFSRSPDPVDLAALQRSLAPDGVLVSYQEGSTTDWALVVTHDSVRGVVLERFVSLGPAIRVLSGLLDQRELGVEAPAAALHRALIEPVEPWIPEGARRVVLIPTGSLHRVPFALLSPGGVAPAFGEDREITIVPSATVWSRWRDSAVDPGVAASAFVIAAPDTLAGADRPVGRASAPRDSTTLLFERARALRPLPHARREARMVARRVGAATIREGGDATEAALRDPALADATILHIATHALVDESTPRRSGIVLSPGTESTEDGLLQPAEIADLALDGKVVVMATCRSAGGRVVRGEGVVGLAHAMFQAGARTVVGSLWPVRDDDAAEFFERMYARLGEGSSVAGALSAAQADRRRAGAPAAAWAGFVVLGDGDARPVPSRSAAGPASGPSPVWWAGGLVAAAVAAWLVARGRRASGAASVGRP